jgi:hypothetical protein
MFHGAFSGLTLIDSSGVLDITDIKYFGLVWKRSGTNTATRYVSLTGLAKAAPLILTGGLTPREISRYLNGFGDGFRASSQGELQDVWCTDVQIGDGTNLTTFAGIAASVEYPYLVKNYLVGSLVNTITFKASASDTIDLRQWPVSSAKVINITLHADYSTSATTYTQGWIARGTKLTWKTGVPFTGISVIANEVIDAKGAAVVDCVITETLATSTQAAIKFDTNSSITRTTIDLTGTSAGYHIELGTSVTAFTLTDVTFTGTPGTDKIHVLKTTGTVTITVAGTTSLVAGDITSEGATVSLVVPTADITVTSTEADTLLQIITNGTQTVLASATAASLVYTHSGQTVTVVAQKAGFLTQRRVGIPLSGTMTEAFTLEPDYNYNAAHGLTYGVDASWSRANNELSVPTWGPNIRDVYSLIVDAFRTESSLINTALNLSMNGPTTLFLTEGAEGTSDADITNMTGGGVRYLDPAGATTAEFVGALSQNVVAGTQVRYELGAGAIANARATGNVNEIIKAYGDSTHGNFDKRTNLQFKAQRNGYRQAEVDVLVSYGLAALEPTLYIISLTMLPIDGLTLGDPGATGLTITDDTAAPILWDAGDGDLYYSMTITDTGSNSGDTILRWTNYHFAQSGNFQGKRTFDWPEAILDNGAKYETLVGILHNAPDAVVGVRVIRPGNVPHPDFTRFQSDSGDYGTPPVQATGSITGLPAGSRIRIRNQTTATEMYNDIIAGTSYTVNYIDGTGYTAGDVVKVRVANDDGTTHYDPQEYTAIVSASGWSVGVDLQICSICTTWGIDGSAQSQYSLDNGNIDIDISLGGAYTKKSVAAWWRWILMTEEGIRDFWGAYVLEAVNSIRQEVSVADVLLQNLDATISVKFTDNDVRYYRSDYSLPYDDSPGYGSIFMDYAGVPLVVSTGGSALTPAESAHLLGLDTDAVNIESINGAEVIGTGTTGDAWRGVGVSP